MVALALPRCVVVPVCPPLAMALAKSARLEVVVIDIKKSNY